GCAEGEVLGARWLEAQPPRREDAQEVAAGKQEHVAGNDSNSLDDAIGASADLCWRLAAGAAVAKQLPIGPGRADVDGLAAFVLAVIPFDEVGIGRRHVAEAGQAAGAGGALEWAREDARELDSLEAIAEAARVGFAAFGERQIGQASVLAG